MEHFPNPFDAADVISTYTDGQAVEDGLLVAINQKDRVTRALWEYLVEKAPKGNQPPNRWPVDLMTWFRAEAIKREEALKLIAELGKDAAQKKFERMIADRKALALSKGIISTHTKQATRVYEENIGGGIYKLFAVESPDGRYLTDLTADQGENKSVLWLLPNENGGITLMFPEDY
jgi:hypothetical protein